MATDPCAVAISEYFRALATAQGTNGPIGEVIAWLAVDEPALDGFERIIEKHGVRRAIWFRSQIADLVLNYVAHLRVNGPMSEGQLVQLELLKEALHVREGELLDYRPSEIAEVLNSELEASLEDGFLDEADDLQLVRLQIAFDLGYDQFLSLCRSSLERGMQTLLDEAIRQADRHRRVDLESRIAKLGTLLQLAQKQRRSLGSLY